MPTQHNTTQIQLIFNQFGALHQYFEAMKVYFPH